MSELMKCGHTANGTYDGRPVCVICAGINPGAHVVVSAKPSLEGRTATCGDHGATPSRWDLAFFEYMGAGSRYATDVCACGYARSAHEKKLRGERVSALVCDAFTARGERATDLYYCGCRGWD